MVKRKSQALIESSDGEDSASDLESVSKDIELYYIIAIQKNAFDFHS